MSRQKKARRFEPRYGVSAAALQAEAEYVRREVDDYSIAAAADIDAKRLERHANCEQTWKHLCLLLADVPAGEQRVLQALLFRDLWLVLELYRTYLGAAHPAAATSSPPRTPKPPSELEFGEWLFDLPQGKES